MCLPEPFSIPELLPGQIGYLEAKVSNNTFLTGQTLTENPIGTELKQYGNFKLMKPSVQGSKSIIDLKYIDQYIDITIY